MKTMVRLFLLSLLLAGSLGAAARPQTKQQWDKMKVGISAQQTVALLGQPLGQRRGKGFETWTYDHGAEVLLYGGNSVVGWTTPASASLDVWSLTPDKESYPTFYSVLEDSDLLPHNRVTPKADNRTATASTRQGYEQFLRGTESGQL